MEMVKWSNEVTGFVGVLWVNAEDAEGEEQAEAVARKGRRQKGGLTQSTRGPERGRRRERQMIKCGNGQIKTVGAGSQCAGLAFGGDEMGHGASCG